MMKLEYFPILLRLRHKIYSLIKLISFSIGLFLVLNITYANESDNVSDLYTKQVCSVNNELLIHTQEGHGHIHGITITVINAEIFILIEDFIHIDNGNIITIDIDVKE